MAEITLDGVKYTTIDDKTAMASIWSHGGAFTILKKVEIGGKEYTVTKVGNMWWGMTVSIPDSVTSIGKMDCCTLTIPASVSTINEISGENGILMLSIKRATPPVLAKATNLAKDDVLIVPEGAAEAYKKHPMWGKFKNISEDPSLNEEAAPASKGSANAGSNKEIAELKKEIAELRKDIANLLKAHKDLKEDFEELKKKD